MRYIKFYKKKWDLSFTYGKIIYEFMPQIKIFKLYVFQIFSSSFTSLRLFYVKWLIIVYDLTSSTTDSTHGQAFNCLEDTVTPFPAIGPDETR